MSGEAMAYVGFAECACPVAATVDGHPETAKDVAQFIRDGLTVERKPVEWVRRNLGHTEGCPRRPARQESLL